MKLEVHKRKKVSQIFRKKSGLAQICPNVPKIGFFGLLRKIESLDVARNGLKRKILWFSIILRKPHVWEKSGSRDIGILALDQSESSILLIVISFEPFDRFLYFFA